MVLSRALATSLTAGAALADALYTVTIPTLSASGPTVFIPASDPRVTYAGRTRINADGSRSFDWEATSMYITVTDASFVSVFLNATGGARTRLNAAANGFDTAAVWVDKSTNGQPILVADGMPTGTFVIRVFNSLEPAFAGVDGGSTFTFMGFETNGVAASTPALAHNIEFVGDSITCG